MATEARGLICLAMEGNRLDQLDLPLMVDQNTDSNQTAFTVSIDAGPEFGVSTGISAEDRARTIQVALNQETEPKDLRRPGHIFPLRARKGGVLKRAGHTEAAVDLSELSGLLPAGVICEIQNSDGSMARLPELNTYAKNWGLKIISIADLIRYRLDNQRFVHRKANAKLPSLFGAFTAIGYKNELDGSEHVALVKGIPGSLKEPVLVRMHSECLTGDAFGSLRCDCRPQLEAALARIEKEGEGVVVYLRQEGRGIGLINKLKAYSLQDGGLDTVQANERLGFPADLRNYGVGAQILTDLGIHRLMLLTNNPRKIAGLGGYGLRVEKRVPLVICPGDHNAAYLAVKRDKLGHLIEERNNKDESYKHKNNIVIFWDGEINNRQYTELENKSKRLASKNNLDLKLVNSTRLLALWGKPKFVWRVLDSNLDINGINDYAGDKSISVFLKEISTWIGTSRVGFIATEQEQQLLHPSQNILSESRLLSELVKINSHSINQLLVINTPLMIIWA